MDCLSFFSSATASTEIYTLSLHDALPIFAQAFHRVVVAARRRRLVPAHDPSRPERSPPHVHRHLDRKSTRLNSSHVEISYAVFCLKKKRWAGGRVAIRTGRRIGLRAGCRA